VSDLLDKRLLMVMGKGGVGKTTVAAALGLLAARRGKRTVVCEVAEQERLAGMFGADGLGHRERELAPGLFGFSVDPERAKQEWLRYQLRSSALAGVLGQSRVFQYLTAAAPGLTELVTVGKVWELAQLERIAPDAAPYDLVVVDAPPTGQIVEFLSAPATFAELIRVGRMRQQASNIAAFLRTEAQLVLTALPEEMAVAETLETVPAIRHARATLGAVVANRCRPEVLPRGTRQAFGRLRAADLARLLGEHDVKLSRSEADALRQAAEEDDARRQVQRRFVRELRAAGTSLELPDLAALQGPALVDALVAVMEGRTSTGDPAASRKAERPSKSSARRTSFSPGLGAPLEGAEVIVVCGSGGVGKTTVSAAIGVHLAPTRGRAALLTIDPARRLATALRLPLVPGDRATLNLGGRRRLEVMQLDTQRTFDELIERHGGSREQKDRILANRFYRRISDTLAGTHEYMAIEKLYELAEEEEHDAIVIDTPPTRSALSFLDAPTRLTDFLGGRVLRWMLRPAARAGKLTLSAARIGASAFLRTFGRVLGKEILSDVVEFLTAFEGMYGGFTERAEHVLELLRSPRCAFVVVTAPTLTSLEEAAFFVDRLDEGGMRPAAVVVNRWHDQLPSLPDGAAEVTAALADGDAGRQAAAAVLRAAMRRIPRQEAEAVALASFADRHPDVPLVRVPELAGDVHDVAGLRRVAAFLFEDESAG
jgi:anion-transporting  ArsA/GET3 family ATPase